MPVLITQAMPPPLARLLLKEQQRGSHVPSRPQWEEGTLYNHKRKTSRLAAASVWMGTLKFQARSSGPSQQGSSALLQRDAKAQEG